MSTGTGRATDATLTLHVATTKVYTASISDEPLRDREGPMEGCALAATQQILICSSVAGNRRREVLIHELRHAWGFYVPRPRTEEEDCQLAAVIYEGLEADLVGQPEAARLLLGDTPATGTPAPVRAIPAEPAMLTDRIECGHCGSVVMAGSVVNGLPVLLAAYKSHAIERGMECEVCGSASVWWEICTEDGYPLGKIVAHPSPRLLRGREASQWVRRHGDPARVVVREAAG